MYCGIKLRFEFLLKFLIIFPFLTKIKITPNNFYFLKQLLFESIQIIWYFFSLFSFYICFTILFKLEFLLGSIFDSKRFSGNLSFIFTSNSQNAYESDSSHINSAFSINSVENCAEKLPAVAESIVRDGGKNNANFFGEHSGDYPDQDATEKCRKYVNMKTGDGFEKNKSETSETNEKNKKN